MTRPGPAADGVVYVCERECDTCIFRKGNLMQLRSGRVRQMVDDSLAQDSAIVCHGTIFYDGADQHAICRGFYDRHAEAVWPIRLARMLDRVRFIAPPDPTMKDVPHPQTGVEE